MEQTLKEPVEQALEDKEMAFCVYEDRPIDLVAVRFLVASLFHVHPNAKLYLMGPGAASVPLPRHLSDSQIHRLPDFKAGATGWNVKPAALLYLLEHEADTVTWLDSDIIFVKPFPKWFFDAPETTIIITEEYHSARNQGSKNRTKAWGLAQGRTLARTVNTGVIRVTQHHRSLLTAYQDMLADPIYVAAQDLPFSKRPRHLAGDQDVLTALLGSRDFSSTDLGWLRAGKDIAQCHSADGFGIRERLYCAFRSAPVMIHSQGLKPWRNYENRPLYLDLTPYIHVAQKYEVEIGPENFDWIHPHRLCYRALNGAFFGNPYLRGIPLTVLEKAKRIARKMERILFNGRVLNK